MPFLVKNFTGFIIGVTLENEFYSFTTMNHSKINIQHFGDDICLTVTKKNLKLTLKTYTNPKDFLTLKSPNKGSMTSNIKESINAQVYMLLEDTKSKKKIFEDIGLSAGVDYEGNYLELFK